MISRGMLKRGISAMGAVAVAAAMMIAGAAGAAVPTAEAAGSSITLNAVQGAKLDGHTFNAYKIGDYYEPVVNGSTVSTVSVRNPGNASANPWVDDVLAAAGVTPATGDDGAATVSRITNAGTIAKVANGLASSASKPAVAGTLTGSGQSGTITLADDGLYLVTDNAGKPIIVGTKVNGKDMDKQKLGEAYIKSTATSDTAMVSAQLLDVSRSPIGDKAVTAGQKAIVRITSTTPSPNSANGLSYTVNLSNFDGSAISAGTVKLFSVAENGSLAPISGADATVSGSGSDYTITVDGIIAGNPNSRIAVEYPVTVKGIDQDTKAVDKMTMVVANNDGSTTTFQNEKTTVTAYTGTFDTFKTDVDGTTTLKGAQFKIARGDGGSNTWMTRNSDGTWMENQAESNAGLFETAGDEGSFAVTGLGDGTYLIKETKTPAGHIMAPGGVSASFVITKGKLASVTGVASPKLSSIVTDSAGGNSRLKIMNISSISQLPQTGLMGYQLLQYVVIPLVVAIMAIIIILRLRSNKKKAEAAQNSASRRARGTDAKANARRNVQRSQRRDGRDRRR